MNLNKTKLDPIPRPLIIIGWVLVLGAFAPMLDSTMVNIAVNQLSHEFNTDLSQVQWVVTNFILAMGAAVPFSGWFADHFAANKVYRNAEIAFAVTSLAAGVSPNINFLIIARIFQGFAAGLILPLLFTMLVDSVGPDKMGRIMAIVGVPLTIGPMVGPIIGGLLVQYLSWRWIFYINLPIAILSIILLIQFVPPVEPKNPTKRLDWIGTILLVISSSSIVYGIVLAGNHGNFTNRTTLLSLTVGLISIIGYLLFAYRRGPLAVLPLTLFTHRNFSATMVATFLAGFVTSGPMLILPLFFQDVRGESVVMAAISLVPQSLGMLFSRGLVGRLIDSIGGRFVAVGGVIITTLSAVTMFIRGVGGAAVKSATQADAFVGIDRKDSAAASVASNLFQQLGSGFSSAILATVISAYVSSHTMTSTAQLVGAYQTGFLWATGLTLLIIIPSLFMTSRIHRQSATATTN
ncbi:DHA2 family efflux MFS transporter permease subunit [Secundilactobacillus kimchicus]|uniref:DHA2 family efflux MFS transporter permease subunit n=1 Tax=Secundilactobacillus kimchicus TaxID=528209 RepID=UPI0024A97B54|nr:DHA2 family efflux MFS transporter permease subunit [Secundilactobacillus kimchicus]